MRLTTKRPMMTGKTLSVLSGTLALFPSWAMAASTPVLDKADNTFMMICTALVLFMTLPGVALFYGGLLRSKNVLSLFTQVTVTFALVCVLWVIYGYSLAFSSGNTVIGGMRNILLSGITLTSLSGTFNQLIHVAFQCSFACITVALVVGGIAERVRFSAVLIFTAIWLTFSYLPLAHMVWGGGFLATVNALDFAGGTVVHINAATAALVGAAMVGKRRGYGREAFKPHNLAMVFIGAAILYVGWFGFNAGSAGAANEIAALAFLNTMMATAGAILSWSVTEWALRGKPSLLGACSGCIAGLVAITPAAGTVGVGGALLIGLIGGVAGLWGILVLKKMLPIDDTCDVFAVHGVCGIIGCLLTGIFTSSALGGVGYAGGVTLLHQLGVQALSVMIALVWSGVVAFVAFNIADKWVGLRVSEEHEREGLDVTSHGESAYN